MKIKDSQITLASSRVFQEHTRVQTDYRMEWAAILNDRFEKQFAPEEIPIEGLPSGDFDGSMNIGTAQSDALFQEIGRSLESGDGLIGMNQMAKALLEFIIQKMISMELLIGELADFKYQFQPIALGLHDRTPRSSTFEMRYTLSSEQLFSHYEMENTRFLSKGVVQTEEGKSIDFVMNLDMKREYVNETRRTFTEEGAVQWIDPLVLTFEGAMPELSDRRFSFDLDYNGQEEELALFKAGSGFLSFDQNKDGMINDGRELFGPATGSGFDELKIYDQDQNEWIDENDAIFNELSIWTPESSGKSSLSSLKEKSVGAIYLGRAETGFTIREPSAQASACKIRESGLFLKEEGGTGVIQEVDFNSLEKIS